jgi:hypothetical protein
VLAGRESLAAEEVVASLIGSLVALSPEDGEALVLKATVDAVECGMGIDEAVDLVRQLRSYLETLL